MSHTLLHTGDYTSPERKIGWLARTAPSLVFYSRLLKIIRKGGSIARKGGYTGEEWVRSSRMVRAALEAVGVRITVRNTSSFIGLDTPCVFVGNHMSILETFILPSVIQPFRNVTFVVKESLLNYPAFGDILASRHPIVVSRRNPRQDFLTVLRHGEECLKESSSIILFPQTTRSTSFVPERFNSLGVKLARRTGVPVIPLAVKTDAWGTGKWLRDIGRISPRTPVYFSFGEPMAVTGTGQETQEEIIRFISGQLTEWGAPVRDEHASDVRR